MCPERNTQIRMQHAGRKIQHGFSIVSAIFLLVILAALGAFMLTFSTVQHTTSMQDVQGAKAYQAARAGVEWGAYQILQNTAGSFASNCRAAAPSPGPAQVLPALGGTLAGFAVSVGCTAISYNEGTRTGANPVWIYRIASTSTIGVLGQTSYVERQIQVTIEN